MRTTLIAALLLASPAAAETIAKDVIAIRAGRVITDAAKPALGPSTIIVTDGRITAINPASAPIPPGARVIDQSSRTLSPGLIDSHVHLTGDPGTPFWREAIDSAELSVAYKNRGVFGFDLAGAEEALRERFLSNLSTRAAADIREEIEILGATRRSLVREAQERIVSAARKLAEEGVIYLDLGESDDA